MRCCCCDFSPNLPSIFQESTTDAPAFLREIGGDVYCNLCADTIKDTIYDYNLGEEYDPYKELPDVPELPPNVFE